MEEEGQGQVSEEVMGKCEEVDFAVVKPPNKPTTLPPSVVVGINRISEKIRAMQESGILNGNIIMAENESERNGNGVGGGGQLDFERPGGGAPEEPEHERVKLNVSVKALARSLNINPLTLRVGAKPPPKPKPSHANPEDDDDLEKKVNPVKEPVPILIDFNNENVLPPPASPKDGGGNDDRFIETIKGRAKPQVKRRPPSNRTYKSQPLPIPNGEIETVELDPSDEENEDSKPDKIFAGSADHDSSDDVGEAMDNDSQTEEDEDTIIIEAAAEMEVESSSSEATATEKPSSGENPSWLATILSVLNPRNVGGGVILVGSIILVLIVAILLQIFAISKNSKSEQERAQ